MKTTITRKQIEDLGFTFEKEVRGIEHYWIKYHPTSKRTILYRLDDSFTLHSEKTKIGLKTDWFARMKCNNIYELLFILSRSRLGMKFNYPDYAITISGSQMLVDTDKIINSDNK